MTTGLQDEHVLVQQCRNGSRDAFEPIVKRYMKDSYYIALGLVGSHDDALEISQEAFYHAYRNIKQLQSSRKFFPWFYQILRNQCFTHLRKRKRQLDVSDFGGDVLIWERLGRYPTVSGPQRNAEAREIFRALDRLPEGIRTPLVLHSLEGQTIGEISQIMGIAKGTVKVRIHRGRKKLQEFLGEGFEVTL